MVSNTAGSAASDAAALSVTGGAGGGTAPDTRDGGSAGLWLPVILVLCLLAGGGLWYAKRRGLPLPAGPAEKLRSLKEKLLSLKEKFRPTK